MAKRSSYEGRRITVGLDLGDRWSVDCVLDEDGTVVDQVRTATTAASLERRFSRLPKARIALEVGTHSPWVSRLLKRLGHEVLVANARKLKLISDNSRKSDKVDAELLARLARFDPELLAAIEHRHEQSAADLAVIRARDVLVRARVQLINHVRGVVKSTGGGRLRVVSPEAFHRKAAEQAPEVLREALGPILASMQSLTEQISRLEERIQQLADTTYPETQVLRRVHSVGTLTALAFVLTLQDPARFRKSRAVGPYLGMVPSRSQSGRSDPQRRITKEGDRLLRRLLVQCAHLMIGPFGRDSDLRRFGLALAARGGKNAKKRAVVAVARKLAVLLHHLWTSGEVYQPLRHHRLTSPQPTTQLV
jgi:transposase